jgi:MOSC domain-containing protein YiiM
VPIETCAQCAFDVADYSRGELLTTVRAFAPLWRGLTAGIDAAVLSQRPSPGVWSALEYIGHSRDITAVMSYLVHKAATEDHPVLEGPVPDRVDPTTAGTMSRAISELDKNAARLMNKARALDDDAWLRPITLAGDTVDIPYLVGHAVHDALHHVRDVGRNLHALGAGAPTQHGTLVQVNGSGGGVPKAPLDRATIGHRGIDGDVQALRNEHGRVFQALCLWSADVIDALRAEGHMPYPGAAGENLTIAGVDWSTIRPGVRIAVGDVLAEISCYATPCVKNAQWFSDGNFRRIDQNLHPGWSRVYAWVVTGGTVAPGEIVVVEPDS